MGWRPRALAIRDVRAVALCELALHAGIDAGEPAALVLRQERLELHAEAIERDVEPVVAVEELGQVLREAAEVGPDPTGADAAVDRIAIQRVGGQVDLDIGETPL